MAMKIIFKNKYDKKVSKRFFRYHMLRNSFLLAFIVCFGVMALLVLLLQGEKERNSGGNFLMWMIAAIGIAVVPLYTVFNIHAAAKRDYRSRHDADEIVEINKEKILRHELTENRRIVVNWMSLTKVVERRDAFYFYIGDDEAFLTAKAGLIQGTIPELRTLIATYMRKGKNGKVPFKIEDPEYRRAKRGKAKS